MASVNNPNDWQKVIRAQSDYHYKQLLEEKSLEVLNKELYKSELERQLNEKSLKKIRETQESRTENQIMTEKIRSYKAGEQNKQSLKKDLQNYLSSEYSSEIQNKNFQKKQETFKNIKEDQEILNSAKRQLDNFIDFKRSMKVEKIIEEKDFLRSKSKEKEMIAKQREAEKKVDQELIFENIQKLTQREIQMQENLRKIEQKRAERVKVFEPVINDMYMKDIQKKSVIENWEKQVGKRQEEEELRKLQMKLENKRKLADGLKSQIEEKVMKKDLQVKDFNVEKLQMDETVRNYKFDVENSKYGQVKSQRDYFEYLKKQKLDFDLRKMNQNSMSPKERGVNQDILKKIEKNEEIEFRGVPGCHPRVSPLQLSIPRAYKGSAGSLDLSRLRSSSQNIQNYDNVDGQNIGMLRPELKIHNPITNPIGENLRLEHNSITYRSRGMNSFGSDNIFKYK